MATDADFAESRKPGQNLTGRIVSLAFKIAVPLALSSPCLSTRLAHQFAGTLAPLKLRITEVLRLAEAMPPLEKLISLHVRAVDGTPFVAAEPRSLTLDQPSSREIWACR